MRDDNGLPPLPEDPGEVCRQMRASSPPASAADLIEQQIPRRGFRPGPKRVSIDSLLSPGTLFVLNSFPQFKE